MIGDYYKAVYIIGGIGEVIGGIICIGLGDTLIDDAGRLADAERKIEALESKNEDLMKKLVKDDVIKEKRFTKYIETKSDDIEKQFVSCPHCGFKNPKGALECSSCYKPIENK